MIVPISATIPPHSITSAAKSPALTAPIVAALLIKGMRRLDCKLLSRSSTTPQQIALTRGLTSDMSNRVTNKATGFCEG